jgi:aminoglycoside phosphotransferase family enzyme
MMAPGFYPHPCDQVELFQTMMCWLLFAGQFVYKVKKPVRFPFLDASTPAKRYRLCQEELAVNQRLAQDVYVGVAGIAKGREGYALVNQLSIPTTADVREFAVVMRRLPRERMLDRMVANGTASARHMRELAKSVAAFHASASIAGSKLWGSADAISRQFASHLAAAREITADSLTRASLESIADYAYRYVRSHRQTLDNRARDGYIREGHGDLRCELVCFEANRIVILHCFEGGEGLRYGDVTSDLASLAVDLELAERHDLASELLTAYVTETNDHILDELLPFYKCHRALSQGRFEALASIQTDLPAELRMRARDKARRLFALASRYSGRSAAGSSP